MKVKKINQAINARAFFAILSISILIYLVYQAGLSVNHMDLQYKLMSLEFLWVVLLIVFYLSTIMTMSLHMLIKRENYMGMFVAFSSVVFHAAIQSALWTFYGNSFSNSVWIFLVMVVLHSIVLAISSEEESLEVNSENQLFLNSIKLLIRIYSGQINQSKSNELTLLIKDGFVCSKNPGFDLAPIGEVLIYDIIDVMSLRDALLIKSYPTEGKALEDISIIKEFYNDNKK